MSDMFITVIYHTMSDCTVPFCLSIKIVIYLFIFLLIFNRSQTVICTCYDLYILVFPLYIYTFIVYCLLNTDNC